MALRCFEAAARTQNFSRAADELHLTHGAISRAVRLLEDDLGVSLFERRNRRVFLTGAGQKLYRGVSEGLGLIRGAAQELRNEGRKFPLVVSCEPTLLMRWLIPRWPDFKKKYPEHDMHLVAGGGTFSFGNGIDLAIRRNDFEWPKNFHSTYLFSELIGPVCRPDKVHRFFDTSGATPILRSDAPLLHTRTRPNAWQDWFAAAGIGTPMASHVNAQVFDHFYFSLQAAVAGLGVAIGPCKLVQDDLSANLLSAPMGFVEDQTGYFLLAAREPAPGGTAACLQEWLRSLAAAGSTSCTPAAEKA